MSDHVDVVHCLTISSGAIVNNSGGLTWMPLMCGDDFMNNGQIVGSGSFIIQLNETNATAALGAIECSITIQLATPAAAPRTLTLTADCTLGNLTIRSDSLLYACILDLAGHELDAANISLGVRGTVIGGDKK